MKKMHIVLLILVVASIAAIVSVFGSFSTYETFTSAGREPGKKYYVIGNLQKDKDMVYDPVKDPNHFIFYAKDKAGNVNKVIFNGENISKDYAQRKGIIQVDKSKPNGGLLAGGFEFKVGYNPIIGDLDAGDMDSVLRLGVNFSGTVNYLAQLQPDILPRQILSPSLANTFWGSANPEQKKLTTEIRKVNLREKLAPENKRKLHPWP